MNDSNELICPYPGLRPFTEEESIFFKGRDTHIRQIIQQLEERKIVVLTGASGDGKSSIVYAGVIPNARAGFFRAQHSNWLICDFRPERAPLQNLSESLAKQLKMPTEKVKKELSYGFSSLVDLYKESDFYSRKNTGKSANLLILADQFEEFFTNTENYSNGKASEDAYITVNLLLETAKIALAESLPVFVIFTMRSDFISQSVAFKGLPETIGFSQFFVPRLNRSELQKVIEDPATLAGAKIAPRLTQVLINELPEGFDQLPLLQHALNRLWKAGDNGKSEIDFLHLAKIGGFDPDMLETKDRDEYKQFFSGLDEAAKQFYHKPAFSNILNLHANLLYLNTQNYISETNWIKPKPNKETLELTLKTIFKSLTKINQGRAVRNRAALIEIKRIANKPTISTELICAAANSFRMPNSTFIRPFLDPEDIESQLLPPDAVLDITHEALIRNWKRLYQWGVEEQAYLDDYEDLKVQLIRWTDNDKANSFLLSRGSLAYFEEWYENAKPNAYWIAKNENWPLNYDAKLEKADLLFYDITEFLQESRKQISAAELAKKRRRAVLFISSIIVILVLAGFTLWAFQEKNNALEQEKIAKEEKDNAKAAQQIAEQEREKASKNEKAALEAKRKSDIARKEAIEAKARAENQKKIADRQKHIAEEKTVLAGKETKRAQALKKIADEQRIIAENERKRAIAAGDSAKALSYLALAQTLAYKAKNNYGNNQINLLCAYQAYLFNKNYGGSPYDPTIYEGLRYVSTLIENDHVIQLTKEENIAAMHMLNEDEIYILYIDGLLEKLNLKTKEKSEIQSFKNKNVTLNSAFIPNDSLIVLSYNNYENELATIGKQASIPIKFHKKYLRAAEYIPSQNILITGGRDKQLIISNINGENLKVVKKYNLNDAVRTMAFDKETGTALIGLQNGELYEYGYLSGQLKKITQFGDARINSIKFINKENIIAVGLSSGHLVILNGETHEIINDLFVSASEIKLIAVNKKQTQLALGTSNNTISLYQIKNILRKPIQIEEKYKRLEALSMMGEMRLEALDATNKLMLYYLTPEDYADFIKTEIDRNFTKDEWKQIVGEEVPYEETK